MKSSKEDLSTRKIPFPIKYCDKSKIEIRKSIHKAGSEEEKFWRKFLNEKADQKKLCIVGQPGDGDCLFHALAKYIPFMNARKLRTAIVNFEKEHKQFQVTQLILVDKSEFPEFQSYLEEHEIDFKTLSKPKKFELYLNVMNKTGVYGQNLEIQAFSEMYHVNVVIFRTDNFINVVAPNNGIAKESIFLSYNGIHYDVLYVEPDNVYKPCPKGKILNPKTGNYVLKESSIGKKLVKERCASEAIQNPVTGRCVNKFGKIGKKLLRNEHKVKNCNETRGLNPKTGRCVSFKN